MLGKASSAVTLLYSSRALPKRVPEGGDDVKGFASLTTVVQIALDAFNAEEAGVRHGKGANSSNPWPRYGFFPRLTAIVVIR